MENEFDTNALREEISRKRDQYMEEIEFLYQKALEGEDLKKYINGSSTEENIEKEEVEVDKTSRNSRQQAQIELYRKAKKKSVKPNVVTSFKTKLKNLTPKEIAIGVGAIILVAGLTTTTVLVGIEMHKNKQIIDEVKNKYKTEIYEENTNSRIAMHEQQYTDEDGITRTRTVASPVHSHNMEKMIEETREKYDDPLIAFYLLYANLDEYCKGNIEMPYILRLFNAAYGTSYQSYNDVLIKNGFKNFKELRNYVIQEMKEQNEGLSI